MEIKQLLCFLAVVEEGKISLAAKKMNISQPPFSQYIKKFEEELGFQLFVRGSREIKLTDGGRLLLKHAQRIVELTEQTKKELTDFAAGTMGTLSIGTISSSCNVFINEKFINFCKQYPNMKFEVYESNTFGIVDMLTRGMFEIGIVRTPFNFERFNCICLETEPMVAALSKSTLNQYFDSGKESPISINYLVDKPLIVYRRFQQIVSEIFIKHGYRANIVCVCDDARTAMQWACAISGIALVPENVFKVISFPQLQYLVIDNSELTTNVSAIKLKDSYISKVGRNFWELLKTY